MVGVHAERRHSSCQLPSSEWMGIYCYNYVVVGLGVIREGFCQECAWGANFPHIHRPPLPPRNWLLRKMVVVALTELAPDLWGVAVTSVSIWGLSLFRDLPSTNTGLHSTTPTKVGGGYRHHTYNSLCSSGTWLWQDNIYLVQVSTFNWIGGQVYSRSWYFGCYSVVHPKERMLLYIPVLLQSDAFCICGCGLW